MGTDDGLLFGVVRCALVDKAIEDLTLEHERIGEILSTISHGYESVKTSVIGN